MTDILQQEQAALDGFIDLLLREQKALVNADVEALISLSENKLRQSEQLNSLAHQRLAMLANAGVGADTNGIDNWLAGQPQDIAAAWNKLLESAKTAQRLNQTNGKLIQTHLQHNQQALATLMSASSTASVYGADGQPRSAAGPTARSIDKV